MDTLEFLKTHSPRLLGSREAADILGCHQETLYRWVKAGYIGHIRVGGRVKFSADQLLAYLQKRTA
jgi:excisionase family DNA binding protein